MSHLSVEGDSMAHVLKQGWSDALMRWGWDLGDEGCT